MICPIFPASVFWSLFATTLVLHILLATSCFCCFFRISYTDIFLLPHTTPCDASSANSTPHRARTAHANIFSRVAQGPDQGSRSHCCSVVLSFFKQSSSRAHVMSHTWLDRAPFPLPHSTPSPSRPSRQDHFLRSATRTSVWPFCPTKPPHIFVSPFLFTKTHFLLALI